VSQLTRQQEGKLIQFLQELIRIPSPPGQEGRLAERLMAEMRAAGFSQVWRDAAGNVIGHIGRGHGPHLVFDAHMDAIVGSEINGTQHELLSPGTIVGDKIYGWGSANTKGSLAAMVYAVELLRQQSLLEKIKGDIYLIAVVNGSAHEGEGIRAALADANLQPDMVLLGNPTNLQVHRGHRGRLELRVTTRGRSAHAAKPQKGVNALSAAARAIFGIELLATALSPDDVLGAGSITVTDLIVHTPSHNAIPDRCTLIVDRRLTIGETEVRAVAELESMLLREQVDADIKVHEYRMMTYTGYEANGRSSYPAWLLAKETPFLRDVMHSVERALGYRPQLRTWSYSTDGTYLVGEKGIPTVGFGPGKEELTYTADEHVHLSDVVQAVHAYAQIIMDVAGQTSRR